MCGGAGRRAARRGDALRRLGGPGGAASTGRGHPLRRSGRRRARTARHRLHTTPAAGIEAAEGVGAHRATGEQAERLHAHRADGARQTSEGVAAFEATTYRAGGEVAARRVVTVGDTQRAEPGTTRGDAAGDASRGDVQRRQRLPPARAGSTQVQIGSDGSSLRKPWCATSSVSVATSAAEVDIVGPDQLTGNAS